MLVSVAIFSDGYHSLRTNKHTRKKIDNRLSLSATENPFALTLKVPRGPHSETTIYHTYMYLHIHIYFRYVNK